MSKVHSYRHYLIGITLTGLVVAVAGAASRSSPDKSSSDEKLITTKGTEFGVGNSPLASKWDSFVGTVAKCKVESLPATYETLLTKPNCFRILFKDYHGVLAGWRHWEQPADMGSLSPTYFDVKRVSCGDGKYANDSYVFFVSKKSGKIDLFVKEIRDFASYGNPSSLQALHDQLLAALKTKGCASVGTETKNPTARYPVTRSLCDLNSIRIVVSISRSYGGDWQSDLTYIDSDAWDRYIETEMREIDQEKSQNLKSVEKKI